MELSKKLIIAKQRALKQVSPLSPKEKAFKLHARKKQSAFRQMVLGIPYDEKHRLGQYGAYLMEPWAKEGYNFCEEYRKEILDGIHERYGELNAVLSDGLMANMLRSEHLPWNVFFPMKYHLESTTKLLKEVLNTDEIEEVTDIRIEWAPEKCSALDDNTSFDTYIEYRWKEELYGVGIEVKYTEEGYHFGKLERERVINQPDCLYAIKTRKCGLYIEDEVKKPLRDTIFSNDNYRQIWRNHLLGETMVMNGIIKGFKSLTLFPQGNPHFAKVLPEYEKVLSAYGKTTFGYITIEKLIELIYKHFPKTERNLRWIDYLNTRYPFK